MTSAPVYPFLRLPHIVMTAGFDDRKGREKTSRVTSPCVASPRGYPHMVFPGIIHKLCATKLSIE